MQQSSVGNEKGIALAVSLFALVIIGALVGGAFFVGRVEQQTGSNTLWAAQAGEGAEAGLADVVNGWNTVTYNGMTVYAGNPADELPLPTTQVGTATITHTDTIRRLNTSLFMVRSTGTRRAPSGQVLATSQLAQIVRIAKPTVGVNAAVTIGEPVKLNGNAFNISGFNTNPPGWTSCSPVDAGNSDDVVGIRSDEATGVTGADLNNVFGFPTADVADDPTINSATFQDFLDYTYTTLSTLPGVKIQSVTTPQSPAPVADLLTAPPSCDKTVQYNYGEPQRGAGSITECYGYFPIVHGTGIRTKFSAGARGQGTLLVDGDLEMTGGFEWTGLIIVRGEMKVTGTGNKITGAILTEAASLNTSGSIGGNVQVNYSKCAIESAVNGAAIAIPLRHRGWTQIN